MNKTSKFILNLIRKINTSYKRKSRAITPIIATILILAMVTAGVVIGFLQILPYLERTRTENGASLVEGSLLKIDDSIYELISESSGSFVSGSYPSRRLTLNLPIGAMESDPTLNTVMIEPVTCFGGNCTTLAFDGNEISYSLGSVIHKFSSTYEIIPQGTLEYLSGSDPLQLRDIASYSSVSSVSDDELTSTNLTLYRDQFYHYVDLNYRPKIIVSQTIENNNPVIKVSIFLVDLNTTSTYVGTTNMNLQYLGTNVKTKELTGIDGYAFKLLVQVGDTLEAFAEFDATTGGFTTTYRVTTIVHTFNLS